MENEAYIFDLDGTLVNNQAFKKTILELPEILNININPEKFYNEFLKTYYLTVAKRDLIRAFDWEYILKQTCTRIGSSYTPGVFTQRFIKNIDDGFVQLIPEALKTLENLKNRSAKIAILTNGKRIFQERVIKRTNLINFVDILITSDELPKPKPYPEAFDYVCKMLQGMTITFVGDHPFYDIYPAANYCIPNIYWLTDEFPQGDYQLSQLISYISNITWTKYRWKISPTQTALKKKIHVINKLPSLCNRNS
ncbi:MAG: HAD family hydrolase [Candidatus Korarchaeota archaeon]|nr:HAD family hydrolase [Thermoproteota archaeon]MCR8463538.1 HAD family hydrolase [Thermoproteota archaeon]MCR8472444.1 HAD family hydrolase [Thermoproteota archaeon]MCR8473583.1 HAD family hydrolase [Thermoproteota archaeon]MCR8489046.1 HAD family hydrolase [Thermoproteota archaeon]